MTSSTEPGTDPLQLGREKYVSLTTFTKDGTPKLTPAWIVTLADGRLGFTTSGESWKARRIANDARVTIQPCDQRGKVAPGAAETTGTAEVVTGPLFDEVAALVKQKYGVWVTVIKAMNAIRGLVKREETQSTSAVIVTLD